jgi:hypothetical protein
MIDENTLNKQSSEQASEKEVETHDIKTKADTRVSAPPALLRPRLVLDTSLFVNPETQVQFGKNVGEAVQRLLKIARGKNIELYMPISIFRELSHFASPEALISFRQEAIVRAPDLYNLQVPAAIFHIFIRELRERINKGLRIAEEAVHREPTADNVRRLRQQYREALRSGMVDSVEDLDVVLLAKEIGGAILSADEGIAKMAEALGIEVISATYFIHMYGMEENSK